MARIVVIGAGLGGLAAAARLHALGHRVTVCERLRHIGGKLGTYSRDGYRFDTGPSLLTMPDVFEDLFAATGDPLERTLALRRVDPHCRYRFDDGTVLDVPAVRDALGGAIARRPRAPKPPRSGRRCSIAPGASGMSRASPSSSPPARPAARLSPAGSPRSCRSSRRVVRCGGSPARLLTDPRLQTLLERYATYAGSDPRRAPAALAATAFIEQEYGCWYVDGGLHQLAAALADRLPPGRYAPKPRSPQSQTAGGRVSGVQLDDGERLRRRRGRRGRRRRPPLRRPAAAAHGWSRAASRRSAGFVMLLGPARSGRPTWRTTRCSSRRWQPRLRGRIRRDLRRPAQRRSHHLRQRTGRSRRRAGRRRRRVFVLVNAPRHGPFDWDAPGVAELYAPASWQLMAERGLDLRDRRAVLRDPYPGGSGPRDRRARRRDLRRLQPRHLGPPSGGPPTARPSRACSSPAEVPIPEADCRWSRCRPPPSPASSARPEPVRVRSARAATRRNWPAPTAESSATRASRARSRQPVHLPGNTPGHEQGRRRHDDPRRSFARP